MVECVAGGGVGKASGTTLYLGMLPVDLCREVGGGLGSSITARSGSLLC